MKHVPMMKNAVASLFLLFEACHIGTASSDCVAYGPAALHACGKISVGSTTVSDLAQDCESTTNTEWAWCLALAAINAGITEEYALSEADSCFEEFACTCKLEDRLPSSKQSNCDDMTPSPVACFSEVATVQVVGKGVMAMRDLQVGDKVLSGYPDQYQVVYAFGHYSLHRRAKFLKIQTSASEFPLEITGEHLVFVKGKSNPVRADSIMVGDTLQAETNVARVIAISTVERNGLYAPLTQDGTLMVDGIRASSYVSLQKHAREYVQLQGGLTAMSQHDFVHMALSPFRMMCTMQHCHSYTRDGMPRYVSRGIRLAKWFDSLNLNIVPQVFFLTMFTFIFAWLVTLETLLQAPLVGIAVCAIVGAYALVQRKDSAKQKVPVVLLWSMMALLPLRSTLGLCGADGQGILSACGDVAIRSTPPTTLNMLSMIGNCGNEQGLVGWFYCVSNAALNEGISNTNPGDLELVRKCVAKAWTCPATCEVQNKGYYEDDPCTSSPTSAPTQTLPNGCFSEMSSVQVLDHGSVSMKDLQVGDYVLTSTGNYQPVYAFAQLSKKLTSTFVQIETNGGQATLEASGHHLVFLKSKKNPVRADSIKVGDTLESQREPQGATVTKISAVERTGLYSPLTPSGVLVVEGIKVSSYTSLQKDAIENIELQGGISTGISQHDMIHMTLSPFRILCNNMRAPLKICQSYSPQNGKVYYVDYGLRFARWAHELGLLAQIILFVAFTLVVIIFSIMEILLGAAASCHSFIVLLLLMSATGTVLVLSKGLGVRARNSKVKVL